MATTRTHPFDASRLLDTPEAETVFLEEFTKDASLAEVGHALGVVARARGMTALAAETGISRDALYLAVLEGEDAGAEPLSRALRALGVAVASREVEA